MNNKGTLITEPIRPFSSNDEFPSAFSNEVKGGHHQVNSLDDITNDRLQEGMLATVVAVSGISGNNETFQYNNGNWEKFITLDSNLLNGQDGSYYLDYNNLTNKPADLLDGHTGSYYLDYNNLTNKPADLLDGHTGSYYLDYNNLTNKPADLLDGHTGSYYLDYNNLTNKPADLLDGHTGSYYLDYNNLTNKPVAFNGGTITTDLRIEGDSPSIYFRDNDTSHDNFWVHINSNNFYVLVDRDNNNTWDGPDPLKLEADTNIGYCFGHKIWTAGTDGSSSGMDADLLDGQHGSYYLNYNNLTNKPSVPAPFNGGVINTSLTISTNGAQLKLEDSDSEDDFWIKANSNNFYILSDRDGNGSWENPHPLQLESDTNIGYCFGNEIITSAGGTITGNLVLAKDAPRLTIRDTGANSDDFQIHVNSNNFYILSDRNDDNAFDNDSPFPLKLEADTNTAYTFGNEIMTVAGGTMTGNLVISKDDPSIRLKDTGSSQDDFWLKVQNNRFYVFADRGDDGVIESPNPLELNADANRAFTFGNEIITSAGGTMTGDLTISKEAGPKLLFKDTSSNSDDFLIHIHNNNFHIKSDREDDGTFNTPHPLQLEADTNKAFTFGKEIVTLGNQMSGMIKNSKSTSRSLTEAAIWLNGTEGALLLDSDGSKRISWNDGGGNFNIRGGNYYNGTAEKYVNTGDGASAIILSSDSNNGNVTIKAAATGTAGNNVSWGDQFVVRSDSLDYGWSKFKINSSGNIGINTTSPSYKLHVNGTGYFENLLTANGGLTVFGDNDCLTLRSKSNGAGTEIRFTDQHPTQTQNGRITFVHSDGISYGSGASFILGSDQPTTTILADGKLMFKEGIYAKPSSGTGAGTRKDTLWDQAYAWGDHSIEGYIKSNDLGSLSGLDADKLDGQHASAFAAVNHSHNTLSENSTITYGASNLQWCDINGNSGTGYNGSTPYNPTNNWYHHIIANHGNSGGYYVDIALNFHTDEHYITRLNNGVRSSVKLWNAGNDGSGSGLDADKLDGQHASSFASKDHFRSLGTPAFTSGGTTITTAQLISEMESDGAFDSYTSTFKTSWSYAGNKDLTGAGRFTETAGTSWITWTDNSSDSTRGNITALAICPTTGGSAGRVFIYNDQGSGYSPAWREVWTSASDGSGSGLDADKLDGLQASQFLRSDENDTATGLLTLSNKRANFGASTNWDSVGFANLTNVHFQGHDRFWIGAGNGTWFTGSANNKSQASGLAADASRAHDLLISTMESTSTYDRGITFGVDNTGAGNSGWRLGKWHSGISRTTSKLVVDGGFFVKGGYTDEYEYYGDDYSTHHNDQAAPSFWHGDTNSGWHDPSATFSTAIQIQSGNKSTNVRNPQLQFHQYGYGGPQLRYDGPNRYFHLEDSAQANRLNWFRVKTNSGYIDFGPANTGHAHIYTDRANFYFNKQLLVNGSTVWNAGNDGSGSGLDADKLDGQHASSFLTSTNDRVFITDTRGAQRAPSYYNDRYAQWDFQNHADTLAGGDSWHALQTVSPWASYNSAHRQQQMAWTGTGGLKFRYATSDSAWSGWQTLWTSGNDGSGSGLDADKLDGQHGSYYLDYNNLTNKPASGSVDLTTKAIWNFGIRSTSKPWEDYYFNVLQAGKDCGIAFKNNGVGGVYLYNNAYVNEDSDYIKYVPSDDSAIFKMQTATIDIFFDTTNNSQINLSYGYQFVSWYFRPRKDNYSDLGTSSYRWDDVYATNGTIQTSDSREKTILDTNDLVIKAIDSIDIAAYKWNSAIEKKGEDEARIHYGVIAQDVKQAFEDQGLVAEKYAVLCYNEWEDEYDKKGNLITEAGNRYGVRYDQLHALKCASLDKKIKELEKRIEQLENS